MITAIDKNTALVLIDLQKGVTQIPLVHSVNTILENAIKLMEAFHKAKLPVVIVNANTSAAAWTKTRKDFISPAMPLKEDWTEIVPEIRAHATDIFITKHTWGAFHETLIDDELRKRNVSGIVLAGIATSFGVESTARQASERAYNVTFAKDAMTDMFAEAHERALKYIFPRIGEIGDSNEIIEKLARNYLIQ